MRGKHRHRQKAYETKRESNMRIGGVYSWSLNPQMGKGSSIFPPRFLITALHPQRARMPNSVRHESQADLFGVMNQKGGGGITAAVCTLIRNTKGIMK